MDAAKAAVKDFMAKAGHHDTTVHEKVAPAVVHETIERQQHETVQTAIDKEVHQDHYHTSVQPVTDRAILPETHHHNVIPVEHRSFEHDSPDQVKARIAAEQAKFRDEQVLVEGQKTHSVEPIVAGEHIHHHVHETIQPVVEKQTIEPHVVHTTVPIHEVHHNAAQHHATSALPAVSMQDFKKQGGVLSGREERYDGFQGEPRAIGGALGGSDSSAMGAAGLNHGSTDQYGSNTHAPGHGHHEHGHHEQGHKATLGEKLNPKVDSDRDGKAGIMD
ncbi:hypothetical protein BAUCODRAFT_38884 [Baudoinia panamericana UAMH 10762]|uniref:Allergen n=1 Tax=Baudoinia panamericana (strain UAMH 10762) TaxID=717646 RepID=M2LCQ1_BAUPA|nr:uncharacterized protein BAUCODRAFT_38884 [Baudoinia panamericana UAMH 10762]EMC91747.1 hypothetical protein BAUCODRAFT_38884 [Baudoinia panamericana UAMH 10762]